MEKRRGGIEGGGTGFIEKTCRYLPHSATTVDCTWSRRAILRSTALFCLLSTSWPLAIQGNDGHFYLARPACLHIYTVGDNQREGRCNLPRKSKCGRYKEALFFFIQSFFSNKILSRRLEFLRQSFFWSTLP